ncbi:MAG: ATPase [Archangium sp.]
MTKESTFVGSPPEFEDEGEEAPQRGPGGPRPSVTTNIPGRRGTGQLSSGFGSQQPGRTPAAGGGMGGGVVPGRPPPRQGAPGGGSGGPPRGTSVPQKSARQQFFPPQPRSLQEAGLSTTMGEELVLKALFFAGELRGADISQRIKLPQLIVDEIIEGLRKAKYIDLKGGAGLGVGKSSMIYTLTTFATDLLRQILDRNRYNGPAPVRLEDWNEAVQAQTVRGMRITKEKMKEKFGNSLVVKDSVFDGLGPAMNSGKAIFFYGPPGNGKTALCQALVRCYEGEIWVPHALLVDDFIIRVYDENLHEALGEDPNAPANDARWVRCKRPLVVVGGELTLETLDLIYSPDVKFYEAPFQLKATNGMLLIDDFGRQRISPKDLLNRWIVPLESEIDFLTLHTGKKLQIPFDVFVAFSTNLDPADLVDDAFLRRVRYKLAVQPPDEQQFHDIWATVCNGKKVAYDGDAIEWLVNAHYRPINRPFAACQPRDLLGQVIDIAHYRGEPPQLTPELLDAAAKNYFVKFTKKKEKE